MDFGRTKHGISFGLFIAKTKQPTGKLLLTSDRVYKKPALSFPWYSMSHHISLHSISPYFLSPPGL
jgi:hypothetical protein